MATIVFAHFSVSHLILSCSRLGLLRFDSKLLGEFSSPLYTNSFWIRSLAWVCSSYDDIRISRRKRELSDLTPYHWPEQVIILSSKSEGVKLQCLQREQLPNYMSNCVDREKGNNRANNSAYHNKLIGGLMINLGEERVMGNQVHIQLSLNSRQVS